MSDETGQITGTKDKDYNVIWFTEACLSNVLRLEQYIQDAERERAPEGVDLFLALARDLERHRLAERELRSAVQRHEALAVELERHGHHGPLGPRSRRPVSRHVHDAGVGEERDVEAGGILALG